MHSTKSSSRLGTHRRGGSKCSDGFPAEEDGPVEQDPSGRYLRYPVLLGRGACKCVFKGFDKETGMEVAWNQVQIAGAEMEKGTIDRLSEEIRVLQQLYHKNIMTLHHSWYNARQNTLNFITEIFLSGTLRQYRKKVPHRINEGILKRWAWQILEGLVYLHGHDPPIVHRDLKCDNIFINANIGQIKIGDLGLATCQQGLSVVGTPEFMAPEIYEEQYDHKVDIYSFGMCLLELATQKYPYCECTRVAQIFRKVTLGMKPEALQSMQGLLREVIEICIAHDPGDRPEARVLLKHPFFESLRKDLEREVLAKSFFSTCPTKNELGRGSQTSTCSAPASMLQTQRLPGMPGASEAEAESPAVGSVAQRSISMAGANTHDARRGMPAEHEVRLKALREDGRVSSHPLEFLESDTSGAEDGDEDSTAVAGTEAGYDDDDDDAMSDSSEEIIIPIDCLAAEMDLELADNDDADLGVGAPLASGLAIRCGIRPGTGSFFSPPNSGSLPGELGAADAPAAWEEARIASSRAMSSALRQAGGRSVLDDLRSRPSLRQPSAVLSQLRISDLFVRTSDPMRQGGRSGRIRSPGVAAAELVSQLHGSSGSPSAAGLQGESGTRDAPWAARDDDGGRSSDLRCMSYSPLLQDKSRPICGVIVRVKNLRKSRELERDASKTRAPLESPTGTQRMQSV